MRVDDGLRPSSYSGYDVLSLAGCTFNLQIDTLKQTPAGLAGKSWSHQVPVSSLLVRLDRQHMRCGNAEYVGSVDWTIHLHSVEVEYFRRWIENQQNYLSTWEVGHPLLQYKRTLSIPVSNKVLLMEGVFIQQVEFGDSSPAYVKLRADHVSWRD